MNLLLDTHALIWLGENSPKLSETARLAIESAANTKYISVATFWEISIKFSLGKLQLTKSLAEIIQEIEASEAVVLMILPTHTLHLQTLPFLHRDLFDRMLVAQAMVEDFTLVSKEELFDGYGVKRVW